MGKNFCCPECGSKRLTVIKDEKPFSLTKAIWWSLAFGVFGILFAFLSGQTDLTVSTWICSDCRYKFKTPNEVITALRKNQKAANTYIMVCETVYIIAVALAMLTKIIYSGIAIVASAEIGLVSMVVGVVVSVVVIAIILIVGEAIRHHVNKYYENRIAPHMENLHRIEAFS